MLFSLCMLRKELPVWIFHVFTTFQQHKRKEDDAKSLTERANELQQEVEYLQGELVHAAERIDQLQRKNDERKTKAHATIRSLK